MHYIRLVVLGDSQVGKTSLIRQLVGEELKFEPELAVEAKLERQRRQLDTQWLSRLGKHERKLEQSIETKRLASLLSSQIELQQLLLQQQQRSKNNRAGGSGSGGPRAEQPATSSAVSSTSAAATTGKSRNSLPAVDLPAAGSPPAKKNFNQNQKPSPSCSNKRPEVGMKTSAEEALAKPQTRGSISEKAEGHKQQQQQQSQKPQPTILISDAISSANSINDLVDLDPPNDEPVMLEIDAANQSVERKNDDRLVGGACSLELSGSATIAATCHGGASTPSQAMSHRLSQPESTRRAAEVVPTSGLDTAQAPDHAAQNQVTQVKSGAMERLASKSIAENQAQSRQASPNFHHHHHQQQLQPQLKSNFNSMANANHVVPQVSSSVKGDVSAQKARSSTTGSHQFQSQLTSDVPAKSKQLQLQAHISAPPLATAGAPTTNTIGSTPTGSRQVGEQATGGGDSAANTTANQLHASASLKQKSLEVGGGSPRAQQHRHSYCAPGEPIKEDEVTGGSSMARTGGLSSGQQSNLSQKQQSELSTQAKIINILFTRNQQSDGGESSGGEQSVATTATTTASGKKPLLMPSLLRQYQRRLSNFHVNQQAGSSGGSGSSASEQKRRNQSIAAQGQASGGESLTLSDLDKQNRRQLAVEASRAAASLATMAASAAQALMAHNNCRSNLSTEVSLICQGQTVETQGQPMEFKNWSPLGTDPRNQAKLFALTGEFRRKLALDNNQSANEQQVAPPTSPLYENTFFLNLNQQQQQQPPKISDHIRYFSANFINNMNLYEINIVDMPTIEPVAFPTSTLIEWANFKGRSHLLTADAYLLVFDLTRPATIQYIKMLRDKIFESREMSQVPVYVIANKADLCPTLLPSLQARQMRNVAVRRNQATAGDDPTSGGKTAGQSAQSNLKSSTSSSHQSGGNNNNQSSINSDKFRPAMFTSRFRSVNRDNPFISVGVGTTASGGLGGAAAGRSVPAAAAHQLLAAYKVHRMRLGSKGPIVSLRRWAQVRKAIVDPASGSVVGSFNTRGGVQTPAASLLGGGGGGNLHYNLIVGASGGDSGLGGQWNSSRFGRALRRLRYYISSFGDGNRGRRVPVYGRGGSGGGGMSGVASSIGGLHNNLRRRSQAFIGTISSAAGLGGGGGGGALISSGVGKRGTAGGRGKRSRIARRKRRARLRALQQQQLQQQQRDSGLAAAAVRRADSSVSAPANWKRWLSFGSSRDGQLSMEAPHLSAAAAATRMRRQQRMQKRRKQQSFAGFSSSSDALEKSPGLFGSFVSATLRVSGLKRKRPIEQIGDSTCGSKSGSLQSCPGVSMSLEGQPLDMDTKPKTRRRIRKRRRQTEAECREASNLNSSGAKNEAASSLNDQPQTGNEPQATEQQPPQVSRRADPIGGAMSSQTSRQSFYDLFNKLLQTSSTTAAKTQLQLSGIVENEESANQKSQCSSETANDSSNKKSSGKTDEKAKRGSAGGASSSFLQVNPAGQDDGATTSGHDSLTGPRKSAGGKRRKSSSTGAALWQTLSSIALSASKHRDSNASSALAQTAKAEVEQQQQQAAGSRRGTQSALSDGLHLGTNEYLSVDMLRKLSLISAHSQLSATMDGQLILGGGGEWGENKENEGEINADEQQAAAAGTSPVSGIKRKASRGFGLGKLLRSNSQENAEQQGDDMAANDAENALRASTTTPRTKKIWYRGMVKRILFHSNKQSLGNLVTAMELQRKADELAAREKAEAGAETLAPLTDAGKTGKVGADLEVGAEETGGCAESSTSPASRATTSKTRGERDDNQHQATVALADSRAEVSAVKKEASSVTTATATSSKVATSAAISSRRQSLTVDFTVHAAAPSIRIITSGSSLSLLSETNNNNSSSSNNNNNNNNNNNSNNKCGDESPPNSNLSSCENLEQNFNVVTSSANSESTTTGLELEKRAQNIKSEPPTQVPALSGGGSSVGRYVHNTGGHNCRPVGAPSDASCQSATDGQQQQQLIGSSSPPLNADLSCDETTTLSCQVAGGRANNASAATSGAQSPGLSSLADSVSLETDELASSRAKLEVAPAARELASAPCGQVAGSNLISEVETETESNGEEEDDDDEVDDDGEEVNFTDDDEEEEDDDDEDDEEEDDQDDEDDDDEHLLAALKEPQLANCQLRKLSADDCLIINRHRRQSLAAAEAEAARVAHTLANSKGQIGDGGSGDAKTQTTGGQQTGAKSSLPLVNEGKRRDSQQWLIVGGRGEGSQSACADFAQPADEQKGGQESPTKLVGGDPLASGPEPAQATSEARRQSIKQSIEAAIHLLVPRAKGTRSASITLGASDCEQRSRSQLGTAIMGAVNVHKTWRDWRQLLGRKKSAAAAATSGAGFEAGMDPASADNALGGTRKRSSTKDLESAGGEPVLPIAGFLGTQLAFTKLSSEKQREAAINVDQLMRINQLTLSAANVVMLATTTNTSHRADPWASILPSVTGTGNHAKRTMQKTLASLRAYGDVEAAAKSALYDLESTNNPDDLEALEALRKSAKGGKKSKADKRKARKRGAVSGQGGDDALRGQLGESQLGEKPTPKHPLMTRLQSGGNLLLRRSSTKRREKKLAAAAAAAAEATSDFARLQVAAAELAASEAANATVGASKSLADAVNLMQSTVVAANGGSANTNPMEEHRAAAAALASMADASASHAVSLNQMSDLQTHKGQAATPLSDTNMSKQIASAAAKALEKQKQRGEQLSLIIEPRFDKKQQGAQYPLFASHDLNPILKDLAQLVRKHWKCNYIECSAASNWNIKPIISELTRALECNNKLVVRPSGGTGSRSTLRDRFAGRQQTNSLAIAGYDEDFDDEDYDDYGSDDYLSGSSDGDYDDWDDDDDDDSFDDAREDDLFESDEEGEEALSMEANKRGSDQRSCRNSSCSNENPSAKATGAKSTGLSLARRLFDSSSGPTNKRKVRLSDDEAKDVLMELTEQRQQQQQQQQQSASSAGKSIASSRADQTKTATIARVKRSKRSVEAEVGGGQSSCSIM